MALVYSFIHSFSACDEGGTVLGAVHAQKTQHLGEDAKIKSTTGAKHTC